MLIHLSISNFAIVDTLELDIPSGMTVITGETGAGKSIMLDALGLALGDRAEVDMVRAGADKAEVIATFDIQHLADAQKWLADHDLLIGNECIFRRVVTREGRSRGYINGTPSTLQQLRILGDMLIDIHSQHEHQSLLKKDTHRKLLDAFAETSALNENVNQIYQRWKQCNTKLNILSQQHDEVADKVQLLSYQVHELQLLDLNEGEVETLEQEQKVLANAESSMHYCQQALTLCSDSDNSSILHHLNITQHALNKIQPDNPFINDALQLLASAQIQVEEAVAELNRFTDHFDADPERLQEIEQRLSAIYDLARKHRVSPEELYMKQQTLEKSLQALESSDDSLEALTHEITQLEKDYVSKAKKLSKHREKSAKTLSQTVSEQIQQIGMPNGYFQVQLTHLPTQTPEPFGMEDIEFLVSTNPGQPAKPLQKVASGGELSRISLAIQVIAAQLSTTPTLVFDEVDVGISGGVAETVGQLLRKIGSKGQVLCVTHLPQVASQGHQHFFVHKQVKADSTQTNITTLNPEEKVTEIARLLGGLNITEHTLAHAKEMITAVE